MSHSGYIYHVLKRIRQKWAVSLTFGALSFVLTLTYLFPANGAIKGGSILVALLVAIFVIWWVIKEMREFSYTQ